MTESTERSNTADAARRKLRRFFVMGPEEGAAGPAADLLPAHLAPFRGVGRVRTEYPLYLGATAPGGSSAPGALCLGFDELISRARRTLEGEGAGVGQMLKDNLKRLEGHVLRLLAERGEIGEAREVLTAAGDAMVRGLAEESGLSDADQTNLRSDVERLSAALPPTVDGAGWLAGPGTGVGLRLLGHALVAGRRATRETFVREARELVDRGRALLEADRRKGAEGRKEEIEGGAMGALGKRYVDSSAMASVLGERRGSAAFEPARREKLERAVEALAEVADAASAPRLRVIHDGTVSFVESTVESIAEGQDGWIFVESSDPCALAAEEFDREAEALAEALRARERVRLETSGEYEAERHEPWLEHLAAFDWRAFDEGETALIDPVVALESASELAERGMVSLSKILRSGRPVQALVVLEPAADPGGDGGDGEFRFEPGYLGMSHREAFVQQSSEARPLHLMEGFLRGASSARAALHVMAPWPETPGHLNVDPAIVAGAAVDSRAHPLFRYDPETGPSWAHRLDFSGNPEPTADWPVGEAEGGPEQRPFTFADFALLDPVLRRHLLPIGQDAAESEDLEPLSAWLDLSADVAVHTIPTVTAADAEGRAVTVAVSRRLAAVCRDRLGFWRTLQELAGVKSEHVRRATEATREEVDAAARAERARLEAAHAAELERVRERAAREAVDRLTAALLDVDLGLFAESHRDAPSFAGKTVDEVAQSLMDAVGGDLDELASGDGRSSSDEVDAAARRLLELIDPEDLTESPENTTESTQ